MKKICGIYKIVSPSGRTYIGQSRNIIQRFSKYKANHNSNRTQIKLSRSFDKYGIDSHTFEVIEECDFNLLNIRERFWQDFYNVLIDGLNCILTETDVLPRVQSEETKIKRSGENHWNFEGITSESTRNKMRISKLGKTASLKTKAKLSLIRQGEGNSFFNKCHTIKSRIKQSNSAKIRKITEENEIIRKQGISQTMKIVKRTKEWNKNISEAKKGSNNPMFGKKWKLVDGKRIYYENN